MPVKLTCVLWALLCLALRGADEEAALGAFEKGLTGWSFSSGGEFPGAKGSLMRTKSAAFAGEAGARLNFDFTGGGAYVAAYLTFPKPVEMRCFRFQCRKPAGAVMTVRVIDGTGQTLQKSCRYGHSDWQALEAGLHGFTGHWGGANDGRVHQPIRGIGILVEKNGLSRKAGHVDLDDVVIIKGAVADGEGTIETIYPVADLSKNPAPGVSLMGRPDTFHVSLETDGSAGELRLLCASHFQSFEKRVALPAQSGRHVIKVTVPPKGWRHFGGQNDGRLHGPIRVIRVDVLGAAGKRAQLRELRVAGRISLAQAYALFPESRVEDGQGIFSARFQNLLGEQVALDCTRHVTDWAGRPLQSGKPALVLERFRFSKYERHHGDDSAWPFGRHCFLRGTFRTRLVHMKSMDRLDGRTTWQSAPVCVVRSLFGHGDATLRPESPWGVGLYLYRYPGNDAGYVLMDRAAAMARDAGVKWSREEFQWHRTEPRPGRYDWTFYDRMVETARRNGIQIYGLLAYWSRWAKAYTEDGLDAYARWAEAVVRRYKDRIHHWEVWNEPNIFFWQGPRDMYADLLKKAYRAIKRADPTAKVLGLSTAGIDIPFIKRMLALNAPFDVLTIHPYRSHLDEDGFMTELRQVKELVDNRPVWITEMGWPTQLGGRTESDQARLLARSYLSAVCSGAVDNMSWYDFREDGVDPLYNEHHFGIVRRNLQPKAAYLALSAVARTLGTKPLQGSIAVDGEQGLFACLFGQSDAQVAAMWSSGESRIVQLDVRSDRVTIRNTVGEDERRKVVNGRTWVVLPEGSPVYVSAAKKTAGHGAGEKLLSACRTVFRIKPAGAAWSGKPLSLAWEARGPLPGTLKIIGYSTGYQERVRQLEPAVSIGPSVDDRLRRGALEVGVPGDDLPADLQLKVQVGAEEVWLPVVLERQVPLVRF